MTELLLKKRVDVNSLELKVAPIHSIVQRKRRDRIDLLLALLTYSNADIDLKSSDGTAALHLVAQVSGSCDCDGMAALHLVAQVSGSCA